MKKVLTILLAMLLLAGIVTPVMAAGSSVDVSGESGNTDLSFTVDNSYIVSIPSSITIAPATGEGSGTLSITKAIIPFGQKLVVKITDATNEADGKFYLKDRAINATEKLEYTISREAAGAAIALQDTILEVAAGALPVPNPSQVLFYKVTGTAIMAGIYEDQLTFTITIGAIE